MPSHGYSKSSGRETKSSSRETTSTTSKRYTIPPTAIPSYDPSETPLINSTENVVFIMVNSGKLENERFLDFFEPSYLPSNEIEFVDGYMYIGRRRHTANSVGLLAYTGIDTTGISFLSIQTNARLKVTANYSTDVATGESELSLLQQKFGYNRNDPLQIQVPMFEPPPRNRDNLQNSTMEPELISYDQLSSLGSIIQENFTISETTTSDGTLISTPDEEITDIGGGRRRSRRVITSTAATSTSTSGGSTGGSTVVVESTGGSGTVPGARTEDVTTSRGGY